MATPMLSQFRRSFKNILNLQQRVFFSSSVRGCSETQSALSFTKRSYLCGELRAHHAGETVTLCGWLQYHRLSGAFIVLRDWCGFVQLLIPEKKVMKMTTTSTARNGIRWIPLAKHLYDLDFAEDIACCLTYKITCKINEQYWMINECKELPLESVLEVKGQVRLRPEGQENKGMVTGDVEVVVDDIAVLNTCTGKLPFEIRSFNQVKEFLRIKHRYLELRLPALQRVLRLRSKFVMAVRNFLATNNGFVEVETPTLFRRTPGGAREFIVPTHIPGKFYSLPQSPQQFKQLLMVGGLDRYFQIAKCYRDEGTKPDRQPEFTQIDLEMSFVTQDSVMSLVEEMLVSTWPEECGSITVPFPRMSYHDAMTRYGCDKPDMRFDWQIVHLESSYLTPCLQVFQPYLTAKEATVQVLRIPQACKHLSNKDIESLTQEALKESPGTVKLVTCKISESGSWGSGLGRHLDDTDKRRISDLLGVQPSDLLMFAAGSSFHPHTVLGQARLKGANFLESKGVAVRQQGFKFLWVDTFPLFLPKEDGGEGLECAHHPFTAPHPEDEKLIFQSPELVRSQHYDLVLNGSEIGGGSIRIHNSQLQRYVLTEVLKHDSSELEHLLEALETGCPPHGGIALGLDRLMAIMVGADSIRDVIAFPKITQGRDPLSSSPASVAQSDLDYYHIRTNADAIKDSESDESETYS